MMNMAAKHARGKTRRTPRRSARLLGPAATRVWRTVVLVGALCGALALAQPLQGGTLRIGQLGDVQGFDPAIIPTANYVYLNQLYDTLTLYDEDFDVTPQLATAWSFDDDGRAMTLTLRPDVVFHDGRAMTASDVVYSLERIQDPGLGANLQSLSMMVTSVEAVDDHTVRLTFEEPSPAVFDLLDMLFIVDRAAIETPDATPNGTGPFRFVRWQPGGSLTLAANEAYWKDGLPYLDGVEILPFADRSSLAANLQAGAIDVARQPSPSDLDRLSRDSRFERVIGASGSYVNSLLFNVRQPPLDDKRVRRAISMATDRQQFINVYLNGLGEPWYQPLPRHSLGFDPTIGEPYAYDPEAARELLAEAGYPDGFTISMISSGAWLPGTTELAQIVQQNLADVGITVNVRELEQAAARPLFVAGDFDMFAFGYGRAAKDPAFLYGAALVWRPGGNTGFDAPEYTSLIERGATTLDLDERREIYREIARLAVDEVFVAPVAENPTTWLTSTAVEAFRYTLESHEMLEGVWLDR